MEVMDGLTATQRFREWEQSAEGRHHRKGIQCVVGISANAEKADINAAIKAGMEQVLKKPAKVGVQSQRIFLLCCN